MMASLVSRAVGSQKSSRRPMRMAQRELENVIYFDEAARDAPARPLRAHCHLLDLSKVTFKLV